MKSLVVIGRRWFDRAAGNTYHTSQVIVDGVTIEKTERAYGYGDHYIQTAAEVLERHGLVKRERYPNGSVQPLWQVLKDSGVAYSFSVSDVSRRKDL